MKLNYADDNNLSAVGDSTIEAKNILKQQTTVVLEWFDQNHLIANTEKFHLTHHALELKI